MIVEDTSFKNAISAFDELGVQVVIDQDATTYLNQYKESRHCRPDRILDIALEEFDPNTFYRLTCANKREKVIAFCAARVIHFQNNLIHDAKLLPPPHPVENWSPNCYIEFKGEGLDRISGGTIYLGGLWVRPNLGLPQVALLMPRLLARAVAFNLRDPISWIWGIFDTKAGKHLASIYGFNQFSRIEFLMHRYVGTAHQKTECLADQALSWAEPLVYFDELANAL